MKTLLLNISDIHYENYNAEDEGLVLSAFIADVKEQIKKSEHDDVYVLIGGDLVQAASNESYKGFDDNIVKPLMEILSIGRDHFIFVAGNHDLNRQCVDEAKDSFLPIVSKKLDNTQFNELIRKEVQKPILFSKFDAFLNYGKESMGRGEEILTCGFCNV